MKREVNDIMHKQMEQDNFRKLYEITITDPLFAAEGLDIDNAQIALQELEKVTLSLQILDQSVSGRINFFLHPLTDVLHPFKFLKCFLTCEKNRRHFLASPNFSSAQSLIHSYYKAIDALEKNISMYKSSCLNVQNKSRSKFPKANAYNFYLYKIMFTDIINILDELQRNSQKLREEIDKRNVLFLDNMKLKFFKNRINISRRNHFPIDKIPVLKKKVNNVSSDKEIFEWISQGRDYIYYLEKRYGNISTKTFGPLFFKLKNFDKIPTIHKFLLTVITDKASTLRGLFPILADQFHFVDIREGKYKHHADIFTYQPLIRRGISHWYQPATSFYFSFDLTYHADLLTIYDRERRPFLNESYVLSQKSSMLDLLLWNGYFHNLSYLQNLKARKKAGRKISAWHYLLIGRSYPSLYFLPFNRSVWRLMEKPNFLGTYSGNKSVYVSRSELPKWLKKDDLKKIFHGGRIRAEEIDDTNTNT